jgi:hypothetical protein
MGLRHVVLTCPDDGLVCCFCSSAHSFALRLPPDPSSRRRPCLRLVLGLRCLSTVLDSPYRGLAPHKFTPMPGVHQAGAAVSASLHSRPPTTLGARMKMIKKTTTIILLVVSVLTSTASAEECTDMEAYAAMTVTGYLDSWKSVKRAYEQFRHCGDDGAIAEGFDEAISALWENQWDKLPEMLKYTKDDKDFRAFTYKRI